MELGARIAAGASAEIFEAECGRVVKLFRPAYAYIADSEERRTRAVHEAGLPVPASFGLARFGERVGLVLEDVRGPTLLTESRDPDTPARLAALQRALHAATAPGLPDWRAVAAQVESRLGADERARYRALVARTPDGDRVYHGDFHPGNVVRSERGLVIVDWPNACLAHPAADVARSLILIGYQGLAAATQRARVAARRAFAAAYLQATLSTGDVDWQAVAACLPLAAAGLLRAEPSNACAADLRRMVQGDTASLAP